MRSKLIILSLVRGLRRDAPRNAVCLIWSLAMAVGVRLAVGGAIAGAQQPAVPFAKLQFEAMDDETRVDLGQQWQQWLEKVPHEASSVQPLNSRSGGGVRLSGLVKLRPEWTPETLLRLQLKASRRFNIYLFAANRGVTLLYDNATRGWIAYVAMQQPRAVRPDLVTLAASDHGRARRSEFSDPVPINLYYGNHELVMTRGDIVLLSAPMDAIPDEVYFDGRGELQALDMVRATDLPRTPPPHPGSSWRPAELEWHAHLPAGAAWERTNSGGVRLVADGTESPGHVTTPIPLSGPREVIVRLDHVTPGTGLFLGPDVSQPPQSVVHFVRNRRDGRTGVVLSRNAQWHERNWNRFPDDTVPYVGDVVWLRLVFGGGELRWSVSVDGRHWAEAEQPLGPQPPRCTHLGLFHVGRLDDCQIELGHVEVRLLPGLASYGDSDLVERASSLLSTLPLGGDYSEWKEAVIKSCPEGIDIDPWSHAATVASLGAGCSRPLGQALLKTILDEAADRAASLGEQLRLLDEVALLVDARSLPKDFKRLPDRYFELARDVWRRDGTEPLSAIRGPIMNSNLDRYTNVTWPPDGVIRDQLLDLIYQTQWQKLRNTCQVLNYFKLMPYEHLTVWADQLSASRLEQSPIITGRRVPLIAWHPLLSERLERGVYSQLVELEQLVDGGSWEEAARLITTTVKDPIPGVAPVRDDPDLLQSLSAAVRSALVRCPPLTERLEADCGDLIQLQVEQAIRGGQRDAVARLAAQYPGLSASQQALSWLADQRLARGQADMALRYYERAIACAPSHVSDSLRARRSIAAAMTGRKPDSSISSDVAIGELTLSPDELDALLSDLLQRQQSTKQEASDESLYHARSVSTGSRNVLELALGKEPNQQVIPGMDQLRVDWPGRQLAAVRHADLLLVHNRFEMVAVDWSTGQTRWTNHPLGDQSLRSRDWPLIPMRPFVHDGRVLARHLCAEAPQLGCWELQSGRFLWASTDQSQVPISDPVEIDGQLAILTIDKERSLDAQVYLRVFEPVTGRVIEQFPLLRVRDSWWSRISCQVLSQENRLFAVLGGLSFCCDATGNVNWIRTSQTIPPEADRLWVAQVHQPPILADGALVLAQVGVRAVEAVEPTTGVLQWRVVMPHIRQLVGRTGDLLFVRSRHGITGLDIATGAVRWTYDHSGLLLASACNGTDTLLVTRAEALPDDGQRLALQILRLAADSGALRDTINLDQLAGSQPNIGPLVIGDDRTWGFFSLGAPAGQREMIELIGREERP